MPETGVALYVDKGVSQPGYIADWQELARKCGGRVSRMTRPTSCVITLPSERVAELDRLLEGEYRGIRKTGRSQSSRPGYKIDKWGNHNFNPVLGSMR